MVKGERITEHPRVQTWPGCVIASIWIPTPDSARLAEGWIETPDGCSWREFRLGETYLHVVARMAIDDDGACLTFVDAFGWPASHEERAISLESLRRELRKVRDGIRLYRLLSEHASLADALAGWESQLRTPSTREEAADLLASWLDDALAGVRLRAWASCFDSTRAIQPGATVLTALWLELANHVVEGVSYRSCACGQSFVRHEGRKAGTPTRADADYCSYKCSRTFSQRRYRADVRQARAWAREGQTPAEISLKLGRDETLVTKWLEGSTRV